MNLLVRVVMGVAAALTLALTFAQPAMAGPLDVLSARDASLYAGAYESARRGDFDTVDADLILAEDKGLVGPVTLIKLMHPTAYTARYPELVEWLSAYGDIPGAERIYALALKRKPAGDAGPAAPFYLAISQSLPPTEAPVVRRVSAPLSAGALAVRQAYYSGDIDRALALAPGAGQRWIAGLASYRLGQFAPARAWFEAVARDTGEDPWVRAAAAYWAARAATQSGDPAAAEPLLRLAATWPATFYGMIADRRLALQGASIAAQSDPRARFQTASYSANEVPDAVRRLVQSDPRAWRAAALMQIDRPDDAAVELHAGFVSARTEAGRKAWSDLSQALSPQGTETLSLLTPAVAVSHRPARPSAEDYPTPDLIPTGGFTLDRALVYAITRQESRFNPFAVSRAGALGLMQVRPDAAAHAAGDDHLMIDPIPLFDGSTNLRVGQDHFAWLMDKLVGYDLLSAIAAYNCGPAPVMKLQKTLGLDDSLMLIESLPAPETRDYVEHVAVAYWTYRRLFTGESPTLDALASGRTVADLRMDH